MWSDVVVPDDCSLNYTYYDDVQDCESLSSAFDEAIMANVVANANENDYKSTEEEDSEEEEVKNQEKMRKKKSMISKTFIWRRVFRVK